MSSNRKPRLTGLALLCLAAASLSGCGFSPLYANSGADGSVQNKMDEVSVGLIPDRPGQLLRQSLQTQLQTAGAPTQELYLLSVNYSIAEQDIGIQADTSSTRNRYTAVAIWSLAPIGNPQQPLTQGQATTQDALNIIDQQYFAISLETNTINQQLADEIAAQIATQVARIFQNTPERRVRKNFFFEKKKQKTFTP